MNKETPFSPSLSIFAGHKSWSGWSITQCLIMGFSSNSPFLSATCSLHLYYYDRADSPTYIPIPAFWKESPSFIIWHTVLICMFCLQKSTEGFNIILLILYPHIRKYLTWWPIYIRKHQEFSIMENMFNEEKLGYLNSKIWTHFGCCFKTYKSDHMLTFSQGRVMRLSCSFGIEYTSWDTSLTYPQHISPQKWLGLTHLEGPLKMFPNVLLYIGHHIKYYEVYN
jgi:hypothetical protein